MARVVLGKILKRKGISKRQFAIMLGMRYHHVFRLFQPGTNPTLKTMTRWAAILRVKGRDLIEE